MYTLEEITRLEERLIANATKIQAVDDLIKARSSEHAAARDKGDRVVLDHLLRAAFIASKNVSDDDGWFPATVGSGPRVLRRAITTIRDLRLDSANEYVEVKRGDRGRTFWRWTISIDEPDM